MNTSEFRDIELQIREEKLLRIKWDEKRKRSMEKQRYRAKMERPRINYIPKGLSVDYEEEYSKYLMHERRIGKLIFDSYHALVETVKAWNNEEKRQEVCRYIKEMAGQSPNHRGMKKKLMDLMPETPFEGEPMAVIREPNDMEKSLL